MPADLEFAGVTVRRGQATLIDRISWRVEEADEVVILGPNGAGKTTLLQVAAANDPPDRRRRGHPRRVLGTVDVFDCVPGSALTSAALAERIPREETRARRRPPGCCTAWSDVGGEHDYLDHERADELLAEAGGVRLADRTFGTLSEGERKRADRPGADDDPERRRSTSRPRGSTRRP